LFYQVVDLTDKATGGLAFPAGVIKIMDIMQTVMLDNEAGAHAAEIILSKRAVLAQVGPRPFLLRPSRSSILFLVPFVALYSVHFFVSVLPSCFPSFFVLVLIVFLFYSSFFSSKFFCVLLLFVRAHRFDPEQDLLASDSALRQPHNLLEESCASACRTSSSLARLFLFRLVVFPLQVFLKFYRVQRGKAGTCC
jgi:hypothetical protein